jgi:hypothetical protein
MIDVDWRQPFIDYLREQKVPSDKNLAEQLIRRAKSYVLIGDKLYRRGTSSGVLMKCVPREEGKDILEEIHKGVCGNHASSRTLVSKAFRRDFYWPIALGDAEELVRRCQGCQYFAKQQHVPAYKLVTIPLLTPKNGTGERLTCGPSLVMNTIRLGKISSKESVKDACGRQCAIVRQKDCLRF